MVRWTLCAWAEVRRYTSGLLHGKPRPAGIGRCAWWLLEVGSKGASVRLASVQSAHGQHGNPYNGRYEEKAVKNVSRTLDGIASNMLSSCLHPLGVAIVSFP